MYKRGLIFCVVFLVVVLIRPCFSQSQWVDSTFNTLSLDERIGQLLMIAAYSNNDEKYEKQLGETIEKYHIGGIIFFQGTPVRQAIMTNKYQKDAKVPLMIGMDAESGVGWRIKPATEFPNQTLLGAIRDTTMIFRIGQAIGKQCHDLGIHVNFAPVVDINVNPKNPVIGIRSFGESKDEVSRRAIEYMRGLESENVMAVAKHFPGHGDTNVDSHLALPVIRHSVSRLDSIELYPFKQMINAGIPGVMVGHLNMTSYITVSNLPATLSKEVVTNLLKDKLGFHGLVFTDAMNMKGVTTGKSKGEADLQALIAGNDVILFPENVEASIKKIKDAIKKGDIEEGFINEKCKKILAAKEKYVITNISPIDTANIESLLNSPSNKALLHETYAKAITLIKNKSMFLPVTRLDTLKIASLNYGDRAAVAFEDMLDKYASVKHLKLTAGASNEAVQKIKNELADYNFVIIYNSAARNSSGRQFGANLQLSELIKSLEGKHIVFCHPATPYGLDLYSHLNMDAMLVSYSHDESAQEFVAQAIFGGIKVNGRLSVSINASYPVGTGLTSPKIRMGYHQPELSGMNSLVLEKIDSICNVAISKRMTPGCQVLVAKDGFVVYNKAFGYNTYTGDKPNVTNNIYDIASITKIASTLPAVMLLYDEKKIELNKPISSYDTVFRDTDKNNITIKELLLHSAGLRPGFAFFDYMIDKEKLTGRLLTTTKTASNSVRLQDKLFINPNFEFRDSTVSHTGGDSFTLISPNFYIHNHFKDSIHHLLVTSKLAGNKNYRYSDIGFIFLQNIVESVSGERIDRLNKRYFYSHLGAYDTDFNAHINLDAARIVPSSNDEVYRKSLLKGFVHDPTAALLGGVAGNAGLFTTADDLAKIMAMYLNYGKYGGEQYIDSTTIALFTRTQVPLKDNRRGLGFDKPETIASKSSPVSEKAPASSYGHTGFTGTIAWNDPDNKLIYIFLSNRTYPDEYNNLLVKESIRTKIQTVIYEAIID